MKILHFLSKIFNITQYEWSRVAFGFLLKMLIYSAYILGSTLLTATFLEEFHITSLPLLYILVAGAIIFGSISVGFFIESVEKKRSIIWLSVSAILAISLAGMVQERSFYFFGFLIFFVSVAITQIMIILSLFTEELFSPLESERTLPFVEAAEPIGGIVAGMILAFGVGHISIYGFFKIIIAILIFLMISLSFSMILDRIPRLVSEKDIKGIKKIDKHKKIKHGLRHIKGIKFLKSMVIVVFIQFALFSLIEYQYTSALDQSIMNNIQGYDDEHAKTGQNTHESQGTAEQIEIYVDDENLHSASGNDHSYASQLAHGLGLYHVIFSVLFFLSQIFISSRLNKGLGIMKTMTVHPAVMLLPSFGLLFFSLATAVTAKAFFEVLTGIHRTAYSSSIYAIKHSIRDYVKEFFEGVAKPMGTLAGTFVLIILTSFLHGGILHFTITVIIILLLIFMIFLLINMKDKYTLVAKKNIETRSGVLVKLEAIEVLTQKGHKNSEAILGKILHKNEIPEIKEKILYSLGEIRAENSIPDILDSVESKEKDIKKAALRALMNFNKIGTNFFSQSFTKHRILNTLKKLFKSSRSKEIKALVIKNFSKLQDQEIIPFIIELLEKGDDEVKKNTIYICKYFNDINIYYYIQKYLKSENPKIKASAIIALWQFTSMRLKLTILISNLLTSKDEGDRLSAIYILGEIKATQEVPRLLKFLKSENKEIRRVSAISLLKMENLEAVDHVIEFILHKDKKIGKKTKQRLKNVPDKIFQHIKNLIKHEVIKMIQAIIEKTGTNVLEEMPKNELEDLMHFYYLIDEHNEIIKIKNIMRG